MNANLLPALPIPGALWQGLRGLSGLFWRCYERRQQRLVLASLDPRQLRDLGLARDEATVEAAKPFWR